MITKIDTHGWYKMALNGAGIKVDEPTTELIIQLVKIVEQKQGETDLKDIFFTKNNVNLFFGIEPTEKSTTT